MSTDDSDDLKISNEKHRITTDYTEPNVPKATNNLTDTTIRKRGSSDTPNRETTPRSNIDNKRSEPPRTQSKKRGIGRRLLGFVGLLFGFVGILLALFTTVLSIRMAVQASDNATQAFDSVGSAVERLETRIDETDDLLNPDGVDLKDLPELEARTDGLVDITTTSDRGFKAVDEHPLYGILPAELSGLGSTLSDFKQSAVRIDKAVDDAPASGVDSETARAAAIEVDAMQAKVTRTREQLRTAVDSVTMWIRIGGGVGVVLSLLLFWAQYCLLRRGWRGLKGRTAH